MDNIEQAGFSVYRQDRVATSGKTRGGGVCLFVNNCWCTMSNVKEVLRYWSHEVEYLMITCRPHYLPRNVSSIYVAVYIPPQTDAGTKTALNELYEAISKQENPEAALLTGFINKCIEDVVPTVTVRTYPKQQPWITGHICTCLFYTNKNLTNS